MAPGSWGNSVVRHGLDGEDVEADGAPNNVRAALYGRLAREHAAKGTMVFENGQMRYVNEDPSNSVVREETSYSTSSFSSEGFMDSMVNMLCFVFIAAIAAGGGYVALQTHKNTESRHVEVELNEKMTDDKSTDRLDWLHAWNKKHGSMLHTDERGEAHEMEFGQFQELVRRAGAGIHSHGLVGKRVILCGPASIDFYIAAVACLQQGVVFVPLPAFVVSNMAWLRKVVAETKADFVITTEAVKLDWKLREGSDQVCRERDGQPLNFVEMNELLDFPFEAITWRIKDMYDVLGASDPAIICVDSCVNQFPTTTTWTLASIRNCTETWSAAGINNKVVAATLSEHTEGVPLGLFLATLYSGGKFHISACDHHPSLRTLRHFGVSHCYVPDTMQDVFDWKVEDHGMIWHQKTTCFVRHPSPGFMVHASDASVRVANVYATAQHVGGAFGPSVPLTVLREPLRAKGEVVVAGKNQKEGTEILYSCGKVQKDGAVLIVDESSDRSNEAALNQGLFDTIGEVWVHQALVKGSIVQAGRRQVGRDRDEYRATGEFGFIDSSTRNLYVIAQHEDVLLASGQLLYSTEVEAKIRRESQHMKNFVVLRLEAAPGKEGAFVFGEVGNRFGDDASMEGQKLTCEEVCDGVKKVLDKEGVPIAGVALSPLGDLPKAPGTLSACRARTKLQWFQRNLYLHPESLWITQYVGEHPHLEKADQVEFMRQMEEAGGSDSEDEDFDKGV